MSVSNFQLLRHIKDEIDFVLQSTAGRIKENVIDDPILSRAVVRSIEIIGEAAKKLPDTFKANYSHIEWKKIAGTRDKLIHDYFGIDYDIVWDIIKNKLPDLHFFISGILKESNL